MSSAARQETAPPFGFARLSSGQLVEEPKEQEVIRRILQCKAAGMPDDEIRRILLSASCSLDFVSKSGWSLAMDRLPEEREMVLVVREHHDDDGWRFFAGWLMHDPDNPGSSDWWGHDVDNDRMFVVNVRNTDFWHKAPEWPPRIPA